MKLFIGMTTVCSHTNEISVKWDSGSKKRCKFFALKWDFGKMGFSLQPASIKLKMGFRKTRLIAKTSYKNEAFLKNKKCGLSKCSASFSR